MDFFIEIMLLFLTIPGRMNFLQFGRYGKFGKQRYRQQFKKQFNFFNFNEQIIMTHSSGKTAINLAKVEHCGYPHKVGKQS